MDEILPELTSAENKHLHKLQSQIENCINDQPWVDGDALWILGQRTELESLLFDLKIPEKSWEKIIKHLRCPYCGHDTFEIYEDVGIKSQFEKEVDKHMDKVKRLYGTKVKKLEEYLEKQPLLAYSQPFAKKIHKEIKNKELPTVIVSGNFFRVRKVEGSKVLDIKGMLNPPKGKPQEGRFNHAGQSHLYLCNDKSTAIKEVVSGEGPALIWNQEFELLPEVENILDLTIDWINLTPSTSTMLLALKVYDSIGRSDRNTELWRPDYYLTRYIMDCAKELGYNGIKYNSTKNSGQYNLVLFNPLDINLEPIGKPEVEIFTNKENLFDF